MNTCYTLYISIALLVAYAKAEPSQCYYCDDYSTCNDPLNVSLIEVRSCGSGNFTTNPLASDSSLSHSFHSYSVNHMNDLESLAGSQTCIKVSGNIYGETETWRGCDDKIVAGVDFCVFVIQALTQWTNLTCSTCDTDLCNGY